MCAHVHTALPKQLLKSNESVNGKHSQIYHVSFSFAAAFKFSKSFELFVSSKQATQFFILVEPIAGRKAQAAIRMATSSTTARLSQTPSCKHHQGKTQTPFCFVAWSWSLFLRAFFWLFLLPLLRRAAMRVRVESGTTRGSNALFNRKRNAHFMTYTDDFMIMIVIMMKFTIFTIICLPLFLWSS